MKPSFLIFACALAGYATEAPACTPWSQAQTAYAEDDLLAALQARDAAQASGSACRASDRVQIDRWVALAHLDAALRHGREDPRFRELLNQGSEFAKPWALGAQLGELARKERRFADAAREFELALRDAQEVWNPDSGLRDPRPTAAQLGLLESRAQEMRLAAPTFVSVPGKPACRIRTLDSWTVEVVVPIPYDYDRHDFTTDGRREADRLADCLSALDPSSVRSVTIIGHADERGSHAYNMWLSERRAKHIYAFLRARGIALPLAHEGRGKTEPFEPDSDTAYTREERWRMDRRVEVDVVTIED